MKNLILTIVLALAVFGVSVPALAQSEPAVAALSDKATMEQDRTRSQRLAPTDRQRALKLFAQAFDLYQAGDFDAAKLGFERGLEVDPANGPANFWLGDILARAGDQERARARYTRAKFFAPDSAEGLKAEVALNKLPPPPPPPAAVLAPGRVAAVGSAFRDCADCPEMVVVPPGEFQMGDNTPSWNYTQPVHRVRVGQALAVGKYDVTFDEWDACAREGGCRGGVSDQGWGRGRRPAINVDFNDASAYAAWLSRKTGKQYRLPTEAEWEYAARGGRTTAYWWGDEIGRANANCHGCGSQWDDKQTASVGSFAPNPFGLYDMAGNVWQWTEDCEGLYARAPADSSVAVRGCIGADNFRVVRGGSWYAGSSFARAGFRDDNITSRRSLTQKGDLGFRVVRTQ